MKALSFKQPWGSLVVSGLPVFDSVQHEGGKTSHVEYNGRVLLKDIENRNWPLPKWFEVPQRIYVHASKGEDKEALEWLLSKGLPAMPVLMMFSDSIPKGAIIGEIDIVDCVKESKSPWFVGKYGFVLANPELYEKPIPCRGKLGFFEIDCV